MRSIQFKALSDTWRTEIAEPQAVPISKAFLLDYLNLPPRREQVLEATGVSDAPADVRVSDRPEIQQLGLFPDAG